MLHRALRMREAMSFTEDGQLTGGLFLCLRSLVSVAKHIHPARILWVFDKGRHPLRNQMHPEYKERTYDTEEKREEEEHYREVFGGQRDLLVDFLTQFGVHVIMGPYEADDTIWHIREIVAAQGMNTVICSDDHDFVQMINLTTTMYSPHHVREYTLEDIKDLSMWSPHEIVFAKGILGDKSDNIPSPCKGLGKVGLRKLFDKMGPMTINEAIVKSEGMGKKYSMLTDPVVQGEIIRNIQLTMLGFIRFTPEEQSWLETIWNTTRGFDMYRALTAIQQYGFKSFAESVGSWCRYFEGIY